MRSSGCGHSVIVVGCGIQGLLAALMLCDAGYAVRVHAGGADPRTNGDTRSSTGGGEAARLITLLEGCPYVAHAADSPEIAGVFEKPVSQGGWLGDALPADAADPQRQWLGNRQAAWLDRDRVNRSLDRYVETARHAMTLWRRLRADRRELFRGVDWQDRGVIRLYDDADTAAAAIALHRRLGVLRGHYVPGGDTELLRGLPVLDELCRPGRFAAGLLVDGFALNVKQFVRNGVNDLERRGVTFGWHSECLGPAIDGDNRVTGLRFDGLVERADHYVLAPGAYGGQLLRSFGVHVAGLAGRWVLVPKPDEFTVPMKVHLGPRLDAGDRRPVLDLNLMAYFDADRQREMVAVGGVYLHVGEYPFRYDPAELRLVDAQIAEAVRRLFPGKPVEPSAAFCVRSLSVDDRPVSVVRDTDTGGTLVLHTGLNTGTTTMGPAIAERIVNELRRKADRIQIDSTPQRSC